MQLTKQEKNFRNKLMSWHHQNLPDYPWKKTNDPYKIWLSEIIMQQTRIAQGTPYYVKFVKKYPTVCSLAKASEDELMKMWEGLGYYRRAKHLHETAKYICGELDGSFPENYKGLIKLKGIGPYSAAAIASFAYKEVCAVVDGNVYRVLCRYFGIVNAIDELKTKKLIQELAQKLIDRKQPDSYNQAIMDFGAKQCSKAPKCKQCVLSGSCYAFKEEKVKSLPVKNKKLKVRERYFHYLDVNHSGKHLIRKRTSDIWEGLFEFILIEKNNDLKLSKSAINKALLENGISASFKLKAFSKTKIWKLTHQKIHGNFYKIEIKEKIQWQNKQAHKMVSLKELRNFAFPKFFDEYLNNIE